MHVCTAHGMLSQMFGNVSNLLETVLKVHNQQTRPCSPSYMKCNKWHPDSEELFDLQLRGSNVLFGKVQRNFCFVSFTHVQSTSESKSAYFCLSRMRNVSKSGFGTFQYKSFSNSRENSEKLSLLFTRTTKSGTLKGYLYFRNALLIFMIFRSEHSGAVTVGMYAHCLITVYYQTKFDNKRISSSEDIAEIVRSYEPLL